MSTELNAYQKNYYEQKFNSGPWSNIFVYGGGKTRDGKELIKPCKRVQKSKKTYSNVVPNYRKGKGTVYPYQAKYLIKFGIPKGIIVHRCNNPKNTKSTSCIEESHMTDSNPDDNNQRRICHNIIMEYATPLQAKGELQRGPVFCCDVIDDTEYKDAINKGQRRSKRIYKNSIKYHKCPHIANGCCFVNYGQH